MTPEEHNLLERTAKLAEENHEILKGIRRSNRLSIVMRLVYWAVILGLSYGAYYFVQPYLNQVMGLYSDAQQNIEAVKGATSKISGFLK